MKEEEDEALTELEQELALAKASAAAEEAAEAERKAEADLKAAMAATLKVQRCLQRACPAPRTGDALHLAGHHVGHLIIFVATQKAGRSSHASCPDAGERRCL